MPTNGYLRRADPAGGNNELETITNRLVNAHIENGNLIIQAQAETYTGRDNLTRKYTSARLKTQGKFMLTYGRIEARMKIPYGQGLWPAFWMLGANTDRVGWSACGEIDIMENIGREPAVIHGKIHGPGYSGGKGLTASYALSRAASQIASHVCCRMGTQQRPVFCRWFGLQGTPSDLPPNTKWVFDHPFFILLNVAVGGSWPGSPDSSTVFPQRMLVDYVLMYKTRCLPESRDLFSICLKISR
jgi:beta-glucanase (GH16 family)